MIFNFKDFDCSPLVFDREFDVVDEETLAEFVGKIILGHFFHIKRIIRELSSAVPLSSNDDIDQAIAALKNTSSDKRDGWIFQIISWLALNYEMKDKQFFCQQPHDAPAQHGLDGVAILLDGENKISSIIITEDKCTENHRVVIPKQVWPEFESFEAGKNNNKLVSRISAMLENLDSGDILEKNMNNIYSKELRIYRVGINRTATYNSETGRKKLFKGYDGCITDPTHKRRSATTFYQDDIREWMEKFNKKVINYLISQKTANV